MKKKHLNILKEITSSIPAELIQNLMKKEDQFSTMKEILRRGLDDPSVPEDKKARFRAMLASGHLDKQVEVINEPIEKQISDYVEAEIERFIKEGKLPARRAWPKLKLKQYARRRSKKSKEEANIGGDDKQDA